jgi:hypothetical protein
MRPAVDPREFHPSLLPGELRWNENENGPSARYKRAEATDTSIPVSEPFRNTVLPSPILPLARQSACELSQDLMSVEKQVF